MSFGKRLQILRRSKGITQEAFAQQLNVSRQAVSKWESSKGYPEMEKILYICNHYGVTMDELFADELPSIGTEQSPRNPPQEAEAPPLPSPPLKQSFSNFFSNLSPKDQHIFGAGVTALLSLLLCLFFLLCAGISQGGADKMTWKIIWVVLLTLFTIGEGLTVGLTSLWFAVGSLAALICALLGGPLWLQVTLFITFSALCLLAIRPLAQRYFNSNVEPTNADRIIGSTVLVTEDIHNLHAKGTVSIGGLVWSARSEHDTPIPAGTLVRILRIEGVKVYVEEVKEENK